MMMGRIRGPTQTAPSPLRPAPPTTPAGRRHGRGYPSPPLWGRREEAAPKPAAAVGSLPPRPPLTQFCALLLSLTFLHRLPGTSMAAESTFDYRDSQRGDRRRREDRRGRGGRRGHLASGLARAHTRTRSCSRLPLWACRASPMARGQGCGETRSGRRASDSELTGGLRAPTTLSSFNSEEETRPWEIIPGKPGPLGATVRCACGLAGPASRAPASGRKLGEGVDVASPPSGFSSTNQATSLVSA